MSRILVGKKWGSAWGKLTACRAFQPGRRRWRECAARRGARRTPVRIPNSGRILYQFDSK